jgi:phosphoglycolate phosphatase-like HAD superfamily hydrolase
VDIDGTLVSVTPNWSMERDDQWVEETLQAEPLDGGIAMLQAFKLMGYELVFLTARGQNCKKNTWKKFQELGIDHLVDSMWHRPVEMNGMSSNKYKEKMILMLMNKYDLKWAMEDEQPNQEMMRRLGLNVINARVWH